MNAKPRLVCTTKHAPPECLPILRQLIGAIGIDRFNEDVRRCKAAMIQALELWSIGLDLRPPVRPGRLDIGDVTSVPLPGDSEPIILVHFWASQSACNAVGHFVEAILWYHPDPVSKYRLDKIDEVSFEG